MDAQVKNSLVVIVGLIAACGVLVGGLAAFFGTNSNSTTANESVSEVEEPTQVDLLAPYDNSITNRMNPIAVIDTNYGQIEVELFDDAMPITAGNFMNLANEEFYDGTKFHRVIDGFMIQGGDPNTKTNNTLSYGTGGPGYTIPDEHIAGEKLTNVRGTIAMANSGPDSGGSQFFINLIDNTRLDYDKPPFESKHPVFGKVVAGMEVVDAIATVETGPTALPLEDVVVTSVRIKE